MEVHTYQCSTLNETVIPILTVSLPSSVGTPPDLNDHFHKFFPLFLLYGERTTSRVHSLPPPSLHRAGRIGSRRIAPPAFLSPVGTPIPDFQLMSMLVANSTNELTWRTPELYRLCYDAECTCFSTGTVFMISTIHLDVCSYTDW